MGRVFITFAIAIAGGLAWGQTVSPGVPVPTVPVPTVPVPMPVPSAPAPVPSAPAPVPSAPAPTPLPSAPAAVPSAPAAVSTRSRAVAAASARQSDLEQVGAIHIVSIVENGGEFTIVGRGNSDARPLVREVVSEENLGTRLARLDLARRVTFKISADLEPGKVRALLQDLRLQAAKDGFVVVVNPRSAPEVDELGDVTVGAQIEGVSTDSDGAEASLEFESATEPARTVPARVIVDFERPAPRTLRVRISAALYRAIDRLRGKKPAPLLDTARDVRDAVRDEVRALRRSVSPSPTARIPNDAVWVLIGNAARGYILVRITVPETTWEG